MTRHKEQIKERQSWRTWIRLPLNVSYSSNGRCHETLKGVLMCYADSITSRVKQILLGSVKSSAFLRALSRESVNRRKARCLENWLKLQTGQGRSQRRPRRGQAKRAALHTRRLRPDRHEKEESQRVPTQCRREKVYVCAQTHVTKNRTVRGGWTERQSYEEKGKQGYMVSSRIAWARMPDT